MLVEKSDQSEIKRDPLQERVSQHISRVEYRLQPLANQRCAAVIPKLQKVLEAFSSEKIGNHHFASDTGYGHGEQGREAIDRVFARVLGAEKAAVRMQFVSGTHAITSALFGLLRPGDRMLSVAGRPYETLEEVIGLRGTGQGSLLEFGISYEELLLAKDGTLDFYALEKALRKPFKLIFIQRSCGYSWRPCLSIEVIKEVCQFVHSRYPETFCFVDNCYGELVEEKEPCEIGADLIAGSLIKNLGGTIVPTGGYVAGRSDLVEMSCSRLTAPGIGSDAGISFGLNRLILQGLFLSPQMVSESLIGADLICSVFHELGFKVNPEPGAPRGDLIQAVCCNKPEILTRLCSAFQATSPVGSYLAPSPSSMPGYENKLVMAGGTFVSGSTSEFSADAPLRPPYNLFLQGGSHRSHIKLALERGLTDLIRAGLLELPQTS